ncbi:MAG: GDP-mannose 4,6-dehydratase [Candidatus Omnitrophota bacterium]
MKVLITGVAGFIGSHLAERLLEEGNEVYGLDIMLRGNKENISELEPVKGFNFFETSILDETSLEMLIKKCDVVYHLAAAVGVENIIGDILKVININVDGTRNVASIAHKYNRKVVFASTSEIYGKSANIPFKEDDDRLLGPTTIDRWVYSSSKALGEYLFIGYHRQGLPMSIVRFFNAYGPKLDIEGSGRVMSRFIVQALSGKQITVIGDGKQTRCFTYVDDVIDGLIKCATLREAEGQIFNIGNSHEISIIDLAKLIKSVVKSNSEIVHIESKAVYGSGYEDIPRRVPDISKAKRLLGFNPKITIEEGTKKTIEWFIRKNGLSS